GLVVDQLLLAAWNALVAVAFPIAVAPAVPLRIDAPHTPVALEAQRPLFVAYVRSLRDLPILLHHAIGAVDVANTRVSPAGGVLHVTEHADRADRGFTEAGPVLLGRVRVPGLDLQPREVSRTR